MLNKGTEKENSFKLFVIVAQKTKKTTTFRGIVINEKKTHKIDSTLVFYFFVPTAFLSSLC